MSVIILENGITLGLSRRVSQKEGWKGRIEIKTKNSNASKTQGSAVLRKEVTNYIRSERQLTAYFSQTGFYRDSRVDFELGVVGRQRKV